MPKTKKSPPNPIGDFPFRKPYPIKKPDNDPIPVEPAVPAQIAMENILKTYVESHKKTLQSVKQNHLVIIKKAQQKTKALFEKDEECSHLLRELHTSQSEVKKLLSTIEECKKNNDILHQNWQELNTKFTNLEKNYDDQINSTNTIINLQKSNILEQDMRIAEQQTEITNLQTSNQELNDQLRSNTEAHKIQIRNLENECANLQEQNEVLSSNFESLNQEMSIQLANQNNLTATVSQLSLELEQQHSEFTKSHKLQMDEANSNNELLKITLEEKDLEIQNLLEQMDELSKNLKAAQEKSQLDLIAHKDDMEKLYKHNQNVSNSYMAEEKRYESEIATLKTEMDRKKEKEVAQQEEIKKLQTKIEQLKISNDDLLMAKENAIKELADEKIKHKEEFDLKENSFQSLITDLRNDLNSKDQQLVQLERAKNASIAELNYKINKIGNVFSQSVGSATVIREQNESGSTNSKQPKQPASGIEIELFNESSGSNGVKTLSSDSLMAQKTISAVPVENPNASSRPQRSKAGRKQPLHNISDFNSETSEEDYKIERFTKQFRLKRPNKNRAEDAKIKRIKNPSTPDQTDIFDKLMASGI